MRALFLNMRKFALLTMIFMICLLITAPKAHADELKNAKAEMSAAMTELQSVSHQIAASQQLASDLQSAIDETSEAAVKEQETLLALSEKKNKLAVAIYKNGGSVGLLDILFSTDSMDELVSNIDNLMFIYKSADKAVQEEKRQMDAIQEQIRNISNQKDEQDEIIAILQRNKDELNRRLLSLDDQVDQLEAEQQAIFAEANELAASQLFDSGDTSGWQTGIASAYGGHSDASVPDNARTATGAPVTESSMGVAVPMAWPDFRSYFGRKVEISYGGKSVIATVNDCGGMGGGSRSLDLQPGVFRAFGAQDCFAWGLRTVSYRFL